ncbi:uncharacterized protein [Henckelia pumila]|uniref:uncharacterized protein n=1 Tax=Henckelia pumila TaxID=405737 RepID=UPI003C6E9DE4
MVLQSAAKDWLYYLPSGSITTWTEMKRIFLEKYFPASRAANIRKEICGIKQYSGESLHENMLDAASGGVFVDKTLVQARNLIENMAVNPQQFGTVRSDPTPGRNTEETRASIQQLNTQMGQLATAVNRLEALNSNSLPSQIVVNLRENVSAITLRSGKELKVNEEVVKEPVQNKDEQESKVEEDDTIQEAPRGKFPPFSEYKPVAPFPLALKESRKDDEIKGLYEVFRRCERKQKLKGCQKVELREQVSAVIQRKVPTKCKNPGPLTETGIVIQMADKSTIFPRGVLEDILVQVDNLVFPADFYVLDMKNNDLNSPILLGRLFLKTSKFVIDVNNGTLTMEFDKEVVKFHIFDTLQIPDCESVVNNLDVINNLSQEHKKVVNGNKVKKVIARPMENFTTESVRSELQAPKKSKKKKQRPKIFTKLRKNRMPPPPQSKFQYDSSVMLSGVEEDSANT